MWIHWIDPFGLDKLDPSEHHAGCGEPVARQTQEGPKLAGAGGSRQNDHASPRLGENTP